MRKSVLWRLIIWLVLMLYLALDLTVFKGPLHQKLKDKNKLAPDHERGIAARVFDIPILLSQLDYAVDKKLWATGRTRDGISDHERRYLRQVALRDIADQYILRMKIREQSDKYPVSEKEIDAAVIRFSKRFKNRDDFIASLKAQGIQGEKELRFRLAAKIQQDNYIRKFTASDPVELESEAKKWYETYKSQAAIPARVKVQHIFRSRLGNSEEIASERLNSALNAFQAKEKTFAELAASVSEDVRTKNIAGDLGWIRKGRVAPDFTEAVFAAELNTPTIIATKLGWHLILVTEKKAATIRTYAEMEDEIKLALESQNRRNNIEKFRITLRKQLADRIVEHWDMLDKPWTK